MDGTIKRSDGSDSEPIPPGDPTRAPAAEQPGVACASSWECRTPPRDRSYCSADKTCVGGGGPVFSPTDFLGQNASEYDQLQTGNPRDDFWHLGWILPRVPAIIVRVGVVGGHLRVASVGCYSTARQQGFEMMALGPLSEPPPRPSVCVLCQDGSDIVVETGPTDAAALGFDPSNDTVLAALRPHAAGQTQPSYTYLAISLDRGRCSGGTPTEASNSVCEISAAQFFGGVLAHALKWKPQFDGGMEASIPYAERRQVDMAKGVIVSASTVFIGHAPNCEYSYLLDLPRCGSRDP